MRVVLQVVSGPASGRKLWLRENQSLSVGRTRKADFTVPEDRQMSGLHFALTCDESICQIRDLNSTNGTYVNRERVKSRVLRDGDTVNVGGTEFSVTIEGVLQPPPNAESAPAIRESTDAARPDTAVVAWHVAQYEQYLDDAGFLYSQRLSLLHDPELGWMEIDDFERRLDAQLDGLVVGGDLALDVCQLGVEGGDMGTAYAATRVFLRRNRRDLFEKLIATTPMEDVQRVSAIADAVRDGFPNEWNSWLSRDVATMDKPMMVSLLKMLGLRRLDVAPQLIGVLEDQSEELLPLTISTLGQLGDYRAHDTLNAMLHSDVSDEVKSATALALVSLGAEDVIAECSARVMEEDWPFIPLGCSGGCDASSVLIKRSERNPHPDALLALGLIGEIRALNTLWQALSDETLGPMAAVALHLITGAELYEESEAQSPNEPPPPEPEPELHDDEETVIAPAGAGQTIARKLTQDPAIWEAWWHRYHERFRKDKRYRLGQFYDPRCLVSMLLAEHWSYPMRRMVQDELVIRYNVDLPFAADLFIVDQQRALRQLDEWARNFGGRFEPGVWYFDGRQLRS